MVSHFSRYLFQWLIFMQLSVACTMCMEKAFKGEQLLPNQFDLLIKVKCLKTNKMLVSKILQIF